MMECVMARRDDPDRYDDERRPSGAPGPAGLPLTAWRLAGGRRCGIHGDDTTGGRCATCDDEVDVPPDPWEPDDDLTPEERAWRFRSTLSAMEQRID